ncbi:hypothetical protein P3X46_028040 [Hevea brasiliensis]|uniref:Glycosyltransferase n=1 Tax=Hevea brasiliensis TaxID=3981 RepID=A0ABQ9KNC3_HEVBR|nr:hypothetical protein P3X46_028040 [Hevea brasiliensis]
MGRKPHVILVPYPAQGHVKVTFVNTESIHAKLMYVMLEKFKEKIPISLVSVPEGLESNHDGKDSFQAIESGSSFIQITLVIADISVGWALEVAGKMGIQRAAFVPNGVGNLAMIRHNPMLIEAGIIDDYGIPMKDEFICLSNEIPAWNTNELVWSFTGDREVQKLIFKHFICNIVENVQISNWLLVNSSYELEPSACDLIPNILPIGSLPMSDPLGSFARNFWPEDSTCLSWLDEHPPGSVIYATFGSSTICNKQQFNELALGLETLGQPFLWVVQFLQMECLVGKYGKIVEWAPQEKVLAHPSTACFFTHCGWNSTMKGLNMGVPFLCWPYCADQFHNRSYICETWKVGLGLIPDDNSIVNRHEIKTKLEKLVSDKDIKANSLKLKEMARKSTSEGGSSFKNFIRFVEQINL